MLCQSDSVELQNCTFLVGQKKQSSFRTGKMRRETEKTEEDICNWFYSRKRVRSFPSTKSLNFSLLFFLSFSGEKKRTLNISKMRFSHLLVFFFSSSWKYRAWLGCSGWLGKTYGCCSCVFVFVDFQLRFDGYARNCHCLCYCSSVYSSKLVSLNRREK